MMKARYILLSVLACLATLTVSAQQTATVNSYSGQVIARSQELSWPITTYTKSMKNGERAFFYDGLYYIVISEERHTVAVIKPKKVKYYAGKRYVIPSVVRCNGVQYTVTEIGAGAFMGSKKLEEIVLPETLEAIAENGIAKCGKLRQITFPSNLKYIGALAFFLDNITEIILPHSIVKLEREAFLMCKARTMIGHAKMGALYVPSTVKEIGNHAFAGFVNGYGSHMTAKFVIQNLPDWVTLEQAKKIGIHEDSYRDYMIYKKRSKLQK